MSRSPTEAKAPTVIAAALAGGDCIDDTNRLCVGASRRLFDGVRAASTVGIWLRAFIWTAARQLDRITRQLLARAWTRRAGPGPGRRSHDLHRQHGVRDLRAGHAGATGFAYTGVRAYHPLVASLAAAGELLHARMRGGTSASGRGAASSVAETISRVRHAGATAG